MRALAQVAERSVLIERRHRRRLAGLPGLPGEVVEDLDLVGLAPSLGDGPRVPERDLAPDEGMIGRDAVAHPRLDGLEIVGRERPGKVEVVVEAVIDGGTDAQLGAGEQVEDRLRHDVRRRVPHRVEVAVRAGIEQLLRGAAAGRLEDLVLGDHVVGHEMPPGNTKPPVRQDERSFLPRFHPPSRFAGRSP